MPTQSDLSNLAHVASLNDAAFARTLRLHPSIYIRTSEAASWRATNTGVLGLLTGLEHLGELRCLCTDGCVAWFLGRDGQLTHGHVAHFQWLAPLGGRQAGAPPQPYSVQKPTGERSEQGHTGKRTRRTALSLALDLLK